MTRKMQTAQGARPQIRERLDASAMSDFNRPAAHALPARREYFAQCFGRATRAAGKLLRSPTGGNSSVAADATRRLPARRIAGGSTALDPAGLRGLIARLERSEQDLRARVAIRAGMLDTPAGAPQSDPLYQRLFFALAGLREQLAGANEELSRSTAARAGAARGFSR